MKFIFADSLDYVDPRYDFIRDRSSVGRELYWDDAFPHELLGYAPYDGILVSRAIVGDHRFPGKYSEPQSMRFRRVGAREFLRFSAKTYPGTSVFGDCGAFSYHKLEKPPYSAEDITEFYEDGGFTHGCSVDHVIFEFDPAAKGPKSGSKKARDRYEITLANARDFFAATRHLKGHFTPMGVVQGWSPDSMARAARDLVAMGYGYIAVGGMVPLKAPAIHKCLAAIRDAIGDRARLHVLGFAKADDIHEFKGYRITSFDTTSPLIRSFKDAKSNYYLPSPDGSLDYYAAIRIPQATENSTLKRLVRAGVYRQERLIELERNALEALRAYDRGMASIDAALDAVMGYSEPLLLDEHEARETSGIGVQQEALRIRYHRTLSDRPWKRCGCAVCTSLSVEVLIFRASNRNKRRGIHNLGVFHKHVCQLHEVESRDQDVVVCSA